MLTRTISEIVILKNLTLKMWVKVTEYNIHSELWYHSTTNIKLYKSRMCICNNNTIFEIITFKIFYIGNLGQGHGEEIWIYAIWLQMFDCV